jgi:hypothetical protein
MKIEYDAGEQEMVPGPRRSIGAFLDETKGGIPARSRDPSLPARGLARVWYRVRMWWTGADIERAWRNIHAAEEVLYAHMREQDLRSRLAGIYAYARSYLGEEDLRVVQLNLLVGREIGEGTRAASGEAP